MNDPIVTERLQRQTSRLRLNVQILTANEDLRATVMNNGALVKIRGRGGPTSDFYCAYNKWKVLSTGKIMFGDAETFLKWWRGA